MFGILGGTGLYAVEDLEIKEEHEITTPFGKPSAPVVEFNYKENQIFFIPRHGNNLLKSNLKYQTAPAVTHWKPPLFHH